MRYKIVYTAFRLLASLPLSFLYFISDIIFIILYYVIKYRQKVVDKNLGNSFPEMKPEERERTKKMFYRHLSDCIVETIKMLHISDKEMSERVVVNNTELIENKANDGKSIILFMGHYGNWEWVQEISKRYKKPGLSGERYRHAKNKVTRSVL